ncbi:MAG TPA: hypothetical protein VGC44_04950 [Longimicrobiales bacterium]
MARYDRIAPLSSPTRETAFPSWLVLRDIEGQDRDADVCRRARLRFLALRPVRRFLERGGAVSAESFGRQLEGVRDDLNALPQRDAERVRMTRFLKQVEDRESSRMVTALLEYADQAYAAGHVYAGEEFALTAELAQPGVAQAFLARMRVAEETGDVDQEASLEHAWNDLRAGDHGHERNSILERLGRSALDLNLLKAADRCFALITQRPTDPSLRSRARAAHAVTAALAGDATAFRDRRSSLVADTIEWAPDPRVAASVHIDLAHGCVVVGDVDFAREHVRAAITIARRQNYGGMLKRAESILTALEQNTEVLLQPRQSSTTSQRIAAQVELLDLPAPAT